MKTTVRVIPLHHLPPGFAGSLEHPPDPPTRPRPASTLVLLRNAPGGLETLLLRRSSTVGFIPGAFVFPGGRVDREDAAPAILAWLRALDPRRLETRLGLDRRQEPSSGAEAAPPAFAFVVAALREAFEETGVLLAAPPHGCRTHPLEDSSGKPGVRAMLLAGARSFPQVLGELAVELEAGTLEYVGHWITPEPERRRYDTRFFATEVPRDCQAIPDRREVTEALWLTAAEALARNRAGTLPLVFPTLRTLEAMAQFDLAEDFLSHFRRRSIARLLPRLARKDEGIEFVVEEETEG